MCIENDGSAEDLFEDALDDVADEAQELRVAGRRPRRRRGGRGRGRRRRELAADGGRRAQSALRLAAQALDERAQLGAQLALQQLLLVRRKARVQNEQQRLGERTQHPFEWTNHNYFAKSSKTQ